MLKKNKFFILIILIFYTESDEKYKMVIIELIHFIHFAVCQVFGEDLIYQKEIYVLQSEGQFGDTKFVIYTF